MTRTMIVAASALAALWIAPTPGSGAPVAEPMEPTVTEILAAAHGAPAIVCSLAATSIGNGGWGNWLGAPVQPLEPVVVRGRWNDARPAYNTAELAALFAALTGTDRCAQELAVRLLTLEESAAVTNGLIGQLAASDSSVRSAAALGLGMIGPDEAVAPLMRLARDAATGPRANAIWALGRISDGKALATLTTALDDAVPVVREAAAGALGAMDSSAVAAALIRHLRDDSSPRVRRVSAWALAHLEAESAGSALAQAVRSDKDAAVREMSAWALAQLHFDGGVASLLAAARGDESAAVRETAVWALAEQDATSATTTLGELLSSERDSKVRGTLAWAMGSLGMPKAPRALIAAIDDSNPDVQLKATWALSEIRDSAALPAVRAAMKRPGSSQLRRAQLRALVKSGESPDKLVGLLEAPDAEVREAVARAIGGKHSVDPWPWPAPRPRPFP